MNSIERQKPSREDMMTWIKGFTKWPHRLTGTKEGRESAEYVKDVFDELGLNDVEIESVPSVCRETSICELNINGENIECCLANGTNRGAETGEFNSEVKDADVVYMGKGLEEDFEEIDVMGKIVVCDVYFLPNDQRGFIEKFADMKVYDPHNKFNRKMKQYNIYSPNNWPFNYLRAKNAGASGFIGILHDFMDCHYFHEDYTDIVNVGGYMELPALWVSKKDGEKLKAAVKSNVVSKGSLHVKTVYELKEALNVKGIIRGMSDDIIVVHSHHDAICRGAVQDASGMSVVFSLAKYFAARPKEEIKTTLMFLSTDSHYTDYEGHVGFINKRIKNNENLILDFAVEHIGKAMEMGDDNEIVLHDESESRIVYVTDVYGLPEIVYDAVRKHGLEKTVVLPVHHKSEGEYKSGDVCSDAYDFNARGIPVVSIISTPMYLFHDSDDVDKVHQESLEPVADMYLELIYKVWDIYSKDTDKEWR